GWGHACAWLAGRAGAQIADDEIDLGLLLVWGTAGLLAVAGIALAAGVLVAPVVLALVAAGLVGFGWRTLTTSDPAGTVRRGFAWVRANPNTACVVALGVGFAGYAVLAALARVHGNVYDDHVIYGPLIKRLLQVGDLDEP